MQNLLQIVYELYNAPRGSQACPYCQTFGQRADEKSI